MTNDVDYKLTPKQIMYFWTKVDARSHSQCWLWKGACDRHGYGRLAVNRAPRLAPRICWNLINGSIPQGQHVLHHCDNPPCVNPKHLFLGSHKDNMRDMAEKGRSSGGHSNKLSHEDVQEIRKLARSQTQLKIAKMYGVSQSHISGIINRKNYWRISKGGG